MWNRHCIVLCVLAIVALSLSLGPAEAQVRGNPGLERQVASLRFEVDQLKEHVQDLHARVFQLEQRRHRQPDPGETPEIVEEDDEDAIDGRRVMLLENYESIDEVDDEIIEEAEALEKQAERLEKQARDKEAKADRIRPYWYPHSPPRDRERRRAEEFRVKRERERLEKDAFEFRNEARAKRGEAKRLRRKAEVTTQILTGWDGEREIVLKTERDLSPKLRRIESEESFITWFGDPESQETEREVWVIRNFKEVERPADFRERRRRQRFGR